MSIVERTAHWAQPLLNLPVVRRTRRNHGLEHATIHVLAARIKDLRMAGRSDHNGFVLIGDVPTEQVEHAVRDALRRMRNGEHQLAVHPNCGTNLVTTGFMTTTAAMIGLSGASRREAWNRLPAVMTLVMIALVIAQPLGTALQRHITTDGDPADLEIVSVKRDDLRTPLSRGAIAVHRVTTRSS
ncbi:MAG: hypothetical protein GYB67_18470 [Chloroflexi bacterium]|nr:hypothetical protein [Chloroflexota bacterium]